MRRRLAGYVRAMAAAAATFCELGGRQSLQQKVHMHSVLGLEIKILNLKSTRGFTRSRGSGVWDAPKCPTGHKALI